MKILISTLFLLFLINCYSYKNTVYENEVTRTVPPKVYVITLKNNKQIVARNLRIENENYIFKDKKEREKSIPINEVSIIKERKFSYIKTIGLIAGSTLIVTTVAVLIAFSNMRISMGEMHMPP